MMLAENVKRVDLNSMDEGRAYQKRMDSFGWNVAVCADKANVSEDNLLMPPLQNLREDHMVVLILNTKHR